MLTPTLPLLIGQLPSALHPFFHFVSLFHFRSRVCPETRFPRRPFPFGTCSESGPSLGAIVYGGRRGPGGGKKWTGASRPLVPPAVRQHKGVPDWPSFVQPRPRPRPRPTPGSRCVYPTGVGCPVSGLLLQLVLLRRPAASPRVGREGTASADWT